MAVATYADRAQVVYQELQFIARVLELFDVRVLGGTDEAACSTHTDGSGASIRLPAHEPGQVGAGILLPAADLRFELILRYPPRLIPVPLLLDTLPFSGSFARPSASATAASREFVSPASAHLRLARVARLTMVRENLSRAAAGSTCANRAPTCYVAKLRAHALRRRRQSGWTSPPPTGRAASTRCRSRKSASARRLDAARASRDATCRGNLSESWRVRSTGILRMLISTN